MADKKASVRLEAKDSGFRRTLTGAEAAAKSSASRMGAAYRSSLSSGIKGGLSSVKSMFSTLKSGMGQLVGIAGGIGMGALVKGAIDSEAKFRQLGFTLSAGTGELQDWQELQKQAGDSALDWSQRSEDLADAMDAVFNTVGDVGFAKQTLDDIAKAAQASGQDVGTIAPIVADLNRHFGVTAEQIPEALASILSLGSRGGASVQDLGTHMQKLGRLSSVAGFEGVAGMERMVGIVNTLSKPAGNAGLAVEKLNMSIAKIMGGDKKMALKFDIDEADDFTTRLEKVLVKTKGETAGLSKVFGENGAVIAAAYGKRFAQIIEQTGGGDAGLSAAVADYRKGLNAAAKSSLSAADVQKKAEENNRSAMSGLQRGIETMQQAFEKPEMQAAISSLAENMPKLAEGVAKAIDWIMKNPALSAGVLVGGKAAMGAISSGGIGTAISAAFSGGGANAGKSISKTMTSAGSTIGGSLKGSLAAGGLLAAASISAAMAIDQAMKLGDELETHDQDMADERENLMHAAELRGETVATRERSSWEKFASFSRAPTEYMRRNAEGKIETTTSRFGFGPEQPKAPSSQAPVAPVSREEALAAFGLNAAGQPLSIAETFGYGGQSRIPQQAAQPPKPDHAAAARAMAESIGSRTLNVKVTNASELRGGPTTGGPPRPGYEGR